MAARRPRRRAAAAVVAVLALAAVGAAWLAAPSGGGQQEGSSFVGSFEVGSPGWQQFTDLQREDDRPTEESFGLVDRPVRSGKRAARITVRHGYSRFGHGEDTSLIHASNEGPGDDFWYAFSTQFPKDWVQPYKWGVFAEWHADLPTSPIIGFDAQADTARLNVHSGLTDPAANSFQHNLEIPLLSTLSKGKWNDFVMHVRWSKDRDGRIELWHGVAGRRYLSRLVTLKGMPTLQWESDGEGATVYLLFGLYRSSYCSAPTQLDCSSPRGVQPTNTLFHDAYARARSFEEVVRLAFPGRSPVLCENRLPVKATAKRLRALCRPVR